jgi:hypothetical protein
MVRTDVLTRRVYLLDDRTMHFIKSAREQLKKA